MFAYAYGANFNTSSSYISTTSDNSSYILIYTLGALLAILGWGLIVSYSENSAVAGLTTTLIVVGISVQAQPLLYTFWRYCYTSFTNTPVSIGLLDEYISMAMVSSLMVAMCALTGRIGLLETLFITVIFNIGWPCCLQLMQYFFEQKFDATDKSAFDDVGSNYVYLFACMFAFMTSCFLSGRDGERDRHPNHGSRHPTFIAMIGTGITFAAFPWTGMIYPGFTTFLTTGGVSLNHLFYAPFNIYLALTASVICTYISSGIFGGGKIGVRESVIGVLGGGVTIACVAGYLNNTGGCITIGAFAGLVSGFWLQVIHPRINKRHVFDQVGIFGAVFVNAVFGAYVLAPCLYAYYYNANVNPDLLLLPLTSRQPALIQILLVGLATGLGIGYGFLSGLLCWLVR